MSSFPVYTQTVFAATWDTQKQCDACTRTSPYVNKYIAFTREMLQTLKNHANRDSWITYAWWVQQSNANQWWALREQLIGIVNNMNQTRQYAASSAYVATLSASEVIVNTTFSVNALFWTDALYRDRKKLEKVWEDIMITMTDLWNDWVFIRLGFKEWRQEAIDNVLKKYSEWSEPLFVYQPWQVSGTQPIAILTDLWETNQDMKSMIYWNFLANEEALTEKRMWGAITFSPQLIEEFQTYYPCAKGVKWFWVCAARGSAWQQIADWFSSIKDKSVGETKRAVTTIKDAIDRLKGFFSKEWATRQKLENRRYELLRNYYGKDAASNKHIIVKADGWQKARETTKTNINNTADLIQEMGKSVRKDIDNRRNRNVRIGDVVTINQRDEEREALLDGSLSVARDAQKSRQESVYIDIKPVTAMFPILTKTVITEKLIVDGATNWKEDTLTSLLGQACEAQCTNVEKKCYY